MSQNDFVIDNNTANAARLDIQSAFQALATNNSGASAPSTPYANQWWYETDTNLLKIRNEANTSWINVAYINQSTGKFEVLDDTKLVNTSGTQTGLLGDQTTATWQAGTGTTESLVSPAKVRAAINELSVRKYDSGYFSFSNSSVYTLTHGLGGEPDIIQVKIQCKSATGGYSVGDVFLLAASVSDAVGSNEANGVYMTSTTVKLATGDNGIGDIIQKSGGGSSTFVLPANWNVRVQAFRFP